MKTTILSLFLLTTLLCRPVFCGEIHDATRSGDLEKVKSLLEDNPRLVNSRNEDGETPLQIAVGQGEFIHYNKEVVELLLAKGADVNATNRYGLVTPLCHAVKFKHTDVVALLVAKGADVNASDGEMSPLGWAVQTDDKEMVELLLTNKADINAKDFYGDTPLLEAMPDKSKEVVELLLAKGADVNAKDRDGHTPLWKIKNLKIIGKITIDPQRGFGLEMGTNKSIDADKHKDEITALLIEHGGHE
jgi:ankyrin repeat protein